MKPNILHKLMLLLLTLTMTLTPIEAKKKLHTIGDSTMTDYATDGSTDKRGWCQMLQQFFDATNIQVNNRGKSGASSKSFYQESAYWPTLVKGGSDEMQSGDILIIQFAHNDEKDGGADGDVVLSYYNNGHASEFSAAPDYRGTTPYGTYKEQLRKYINEAKAMGVKPILVSGICRKYFKDNNGKSINAAGQHNLYQSFTKCDGTTYSTGNSLATDDHSMDYPYQMSQVAAEYDDVPYINLTAGTKELYESYGDAYCTSNLFCADDGTHVCALGATLIARKFATMLKSQWESETDAKKKAVLGELAENLVLSSDISFNPTTGDMGESYVGMSATKEYNVSAFGLSNETGTFTISASEGFQVSIDKSNWASSVNVDYSGYTLISTVYVKAAITKAGAMTGTLTASDGTNSKSLDLTVKGIDLSGGTETTCVWPLNSTAVTATSELLTGADVAVTGMKATSNLASPTSPEGHGKMLLFTTTDGSWPAGEIDENSTRYIEFKATVPDGKTFNMDKISFDVVGWGGNSCRYHAYYATKSDFSDQVLLSEDLSMTNKVAETVSADVVRKIEEGESIYIRVYPWLNVSSAATGKYIGLSDVTIHGMLSNAGGVDITGMVTRALVGANDDAAYDPNELSACFANIKTEVGSDLLESSTATWSGTTDDGKVMTNFATMKNVVTGSTPNAGNTVTFTYTPCDGYNFVPTAVSLRGAKFGTDGGTWTIVASAGTTSATICSAASVNRSAKGNELATLGGDISNVVATADNPLKIAVSVCSFGTSTSGSKNFGIADLIISGKMTGSGDVGTKYALNVTVSPAGAGTVTKDPQMDSYKEGKKVTLTATKNFGYKFTGWQDANGTVVSTENPYTVTMDAEKNLTAAFEVVPTYTIKTNCINDSEMSGMGSVTLSPNNNNGKYEAGDEITVKASTSDIAKFMHWEDGTTANPRSYTVNSDATLTATYEIQDFIAVFDASKTAAYDYSGNGFAADITWDSNRNANCRIVRVSDGTAVYTNDGKTVGSAGTPVVRNREGVVLSGINGLYQNGYRTSDIAWQYQFSTKGFTSAKFKGDMAAKNMAHKNYKAQYSLDGTTFTDIDGATWAMTANVIVPVSFNLPAACVGQDLVYVRVTGTGTEQLSSSYSVFNQFLGLDYYEHSESGIGNLYILGEAEAVVDPEPPTVASTIPVNGATGVSAGGSITISYNKKIQAGSVVGATATLDGKVVTPTWNTRSVSFSYAGLAYGSQHTLTIPAGYVESKSGVATTDAYTLTFTVMDRQKPTARIFDAVVDKTLTLEHGKFIAATETMPKQYRYIQDAIDDAPTAATKPYLIYIKEGYYDDGNISFNDSYGQHYDTTQSDPSTTYVVVKDINGNGTDANGKKWDDCKLIYINKPNVHLIGQAVDKVTIATDRMDGGDLSRPEKPWYHVNAGAAVEIQSGADNTVLSTLTIDNENWTKEKKEGPQALCLNTYADRCVYNELNVQSYQDDYKCAGTYNRAFWYKSRFEGSVDYIYGDCDVWFEECEQDINRKAGGYIVAPSHPLETRWGYVFNNNTIKSSLYGDDCQVYLGRPWHGYPKTVFLNTKMEVKPYAGYWWETMGGLPALWAVKYITDGNGVPMSETSRSTYYAIESDGTFADGTYATKELQADGKYKYTKTDTKNSLTDAEAAQYTIANVMAGDGTSESTGVWNPLAIVEKTATPIASVNGNIATWTTDEYAICYVVTVNGKPVAFVTEGQYVGNEGDVVTVQSVNENGILSVASKTVTLQASTAVTNVLSQENQQAGANANGKFIQNNKVVIAKKGKKYNAAGTCIK